MGLYRTWVRYYTKGRSLPLSRGAMFHPPAVPRCPTTPFTQRGAAASFLQTHPPARFFGRIFQPWTLKTLTALCEPDVGNRRSKPKENNQ